MLMRRLVCALRCHAAPVNILMSLSSPPSAPVLALFMSMRPFVQGGPPVPKKDIEKKRKRYLISPHTEEMEAKYQRRQREVHEYFATHEPNCPEPLPENGFIKGQFGMRRRYYVDRRDKIDPHALGNAVDEGTNAMRK
ncbi:conserved hypothetical protein [Leishmania braziliensis MHOM/BR/75/M2904]|uniref:Uncharacterized protein n=1 Tax=Leishmania braziliensis TaxID=5660 RepID=A4H9E6_LEIBR|nr:conserved hypothetical protein [Leishmania braziliensis MHOM/BR/75/M2904]CAJ2470322.1 unnamed protein product [Leishmania braziliensis]CAM38018.1 conserved hypothetical protein [Leishmania braziliensis MHOM/BR/75/M2904]